MAPFPIVLLGKHPSMAIDFITLMLPEYDVIHVSHSLTTALSELPSVFTGQSIPSASGLGTNVAALKPQIPLAVFCGGGFTSEEVESMREVGGAKSVPWLVATALRGVGAPPNMEVIVRRTKARFAERGFVEGGEWDRRGEIWEL